MNKNAINLQSDIAELHAIAAKLKSSFKKLSISTIADLLWYFPWRYDDLSQVKKIKELEENELATIKVKIKSLKSYRSFKQKMIITEMLAADDTDNIKATWFRQKFVSRILKSGDLIYLSGKPQKKCGLWQLTNPTYEKVRPDPLHSARLVPIYHLSGQLTQKQLRFLISKALKDIGGITESLPEDILSQESFPSLYQSLQEIHFPHNDKTLQPASDRLKFEELFYLQLKYQLAKADYQKQPTYPLSLDDRVVNQAVKALPFQLTLDQQKALYDVLSDLSQDSPMNRLIEGDVGSGKTVVALLAALNVMASSNQTALMAPTEILAGQHFETAQKVLPGEYLPQIALLTRTQCRRGDQKELKKSQLNTEIKQGKIRLIIGTHSLIQEKLSFKNLALVVIDEQHRFGVRQRQALKNKNPDQRVPHLLSMTATPIPRTLTLTLYGDLDISLIQEKPAGRKDIKTFLVPESKRSGAYNFIQEKIDQGQQAFVICPLIDESDKLGVKSVTAEYQKLKNDIFPKLDIRMLHGKLKADKKEKIMSDFKNNKFPILVATSVIEVGVDIPRATIMMIESAERFGLSQLHQFRGRIGRNELESFCLLFTTDESQLNKKRLKALTKTGDGFELAELDLSLRGAGEIFGTKQTGLVKLKIARLNDTEIIKKAQKWAQLVLSDKKYQKYYQQNHLAEWQTTSHLE